jgi:hypothetical protein
MKAVCPAPEADGNMRHAFIFRHSDWRSNLLALSQHLRSRIRFSELGVEEIPGQEFIP